MKNLLKIIIILILLLIPVIINSTPPEKVLIVGSFNFPPGIFLNKQGETEGFFVDLLEEIAKEEGWKLEFRFTTWSKGLEMMSNSELDIWTSTAYTETRDEYMDYTEEPVLTTWVEVFSSTKSKINSIFDLKDKSVGMMRRDINGIIFREYADKLEISCNIRYYEDYAKVFADLGANIIDAAVTNNMAGGSYSTSHKIRRTNIVLSPFLIYYTVPEGKNIYVLEAIDYYLKKWKHDDDSVYYKSLDTWLHKKANVQNVIPNSVKIAGIVAMFGLFVMLTITLLFKRKIKLKSRDILENEADYKSTLEHLLIGIVVHNKDTGIIMCNEEAEKILGLTHDQMIGKGVTAEEWSFVAEDLSIIKLKDYPVNKVINTGKPLKDRVLGINRPDKPYTTWVLVNAVPIFTMTGKLKKIIVNFIDITHIKQTEEQLIKNEQFLYTTSKLAKVGGWELTNKHTITWSKELYYMHEIPIGEEISLDILINEFFSEQKELIDEAFTELFNNKQKISIQLKLITRKTKTLKWLRVIATPLLGSNGEVKKAIGATQDITTVHNFAKEKELMSKQLQQSQKMEAIGTLAGGIAHDFNNILSGIFGYTQLAEMSVETPDKARKHLKMVVSSAQRAAALVQQILTFSRTSNAPPAPLKIYLVIKEAMKLLRASIPSSIKLTIDIQSKDSVKIDPTQVHQVIMNLVTNAYQAIGDVDQGEITVVVEQSFVDKKGLVPKLGLKSGNYIKLSVCDTGPGMTKEVQERLFDPYFTTRVKSKGTGLGLSIVHGIITNAGGRIDVYSELNIGSSFHVYLPISNELSEEEKGKIVITDKKLLKGTETLMIVDDEPMVVSAFQTILGKYGYSVDIFKNGALGLAAFEEAPTKYNLIITDQTMPIMTGAEMSKHILEINPNIPIVLCTGHTTQVTKEQWKTIGIKGVLSKPVLTSDLLMAIRTILNEENTECT